MGPTKEPRHIFNYLVRLDLSIGKTMIFEGEKP